MKKHVYLVGPLDTPEEVEALANFLWETNRINNPLSPKKINEFILEINPPPNRPRPPRTFVDIRTDIRLFLDFLRRNRIIHGAIDEQYEQDIVNALQEGGLLLDAKTSFRSQKKRFANQEPTKKPKRRKRHVDEDEDDIYSPKKD